MAISLHTKLCDMLGIEYPVIAFNHCRDVVAAVCNAGGSSVLGAVMLSPEQITIETDWIKAHTSHPFGIDLVLPSSSPQVTTSDELLAHVPKEYREFMDKVKQELGLPYDAFCGEQGMDSGMTGMGGSREFQMKQLDAALKAKPAFIATGLGFRREMVGECHAAGVKMTTLVGNVKNARRAAEAGVDFIVAQGTEAGGHTGRIGTMALVPQVVDAVSPIPVLAAGGIGDGRGLVAALALGAVGAWTGTVWLTSHESPLAEWIKDRMLEATDEDTVITRIYTAKTNRSLKNKYIERWQQPDAPPTLPLPLQNFYSPMPQSILTEFPKSHALFDKPNLRDWVSTPSGQVVGLIKQRKSVRQIMYDMISQAVEILGTD